MQDAPNEQSMRNELEITQRGARIMTKGHAGEGQESKWEILRQSLSPQ
jgi:hypothetical protein